MEQWIAFIRADCKSIMSSDDLETLKTNFQEKGNSFKLIIPYDPIFLMTQSSHRSPRLYQKEGTEYVSGLKKYLPLVTIETLSYHDYLGEKVYSCIKFDPEEEEEEEFDKADAKDLHKLMSGIENYLETNRMEDHEIVKDKVSKLKLLCEVAQRYNLEILLHDEYY